MGVGRIVIKNDLNIIRVLNRQIEVKPPNHYK